MKRESYHKLRQRGNNLHNQSPAGGQDQSCGFSSLISLNNNSYYNQSSDPPTIAYGQIRPAAMQSQIQDPQALRSSLADDVLRPKPDELISPANSKADPEQVADPIEGKYNVASSSSSPSSSSSGEQQEEGYSPPPRQARKKSPDVLKAEQA